MYPIAFHFFRQSRAPDLQPASRVGHDAMRIVKRPSNQCDLDIFQISLQRHTLAGQLEILWLRP